MLLVSLRSHREDLETVLAIDDDAAVAARRTLDEEKWSAEERDS